MKKQLRKKIADWAENEFAEQYVEQAMQGLIEVAQGDREGSVIEMQTLHKLSDGELFPEVVDSDDDDPVPNFVNAMIQDVGDLFNGETAYDTCKAAIEALHGAEVFDDDEHEEALAALESCVDD